MCSGSGSYLFDLRYAISTSGATQPSPITVWIEYDVTFHTPQIESVQQPSHASQTYLFSEYDKNFFCIPNETLDSTNTYSWEINGEYEGFIYETTAVSTTYSSTYNYGTITVTYVDQSTATIELKYQSGQDTPTCTFSDIKGEQVTGYDATSPANYNWIKFYNSQKKIEQIKAIINTTGSYHRCLIVPYSA
jgi:hypothetical protein